MGPAESEARSFRVAEAGPLSQDRGAWQARGEVGVGEEECFGRWPRGPLPQALGELWSYLPPPLGLQCLPGNP